MKRQKKKNFFTVRNFRKDREAREACEDGDRRHFIGKIRIGKLSVNTTLF